MVAVLLIGALAVLVGCSSEEKKEKAPEPSLCFFSSNGDGTCLVRGYNESLCPDGVLVIPDTSPDGEKVVGIAETGFSHDEYLKSITIPEGVTTIAGNAFVGCSALTEIIMPDSVTDIGAHAFAECTALESIKWSAGLKVLGTSAFAECTALKSIEIPNGVEVLGIPDGTWINEGDVVNYTIFEGCTSLTSVKIGSGVTRFSADVFTNCPALTNITVAEGNSAFKAVDNCLIEIATKTLVLGGANSKIPTDGSVTVIGPQSFAARDGLTQINIPDTIEKIGASAFEQTDLEDISIPDSVTTIESGAFEECTLLENVVIPASVTTMGNAAFFKCTSLTACTIQNADISIGGYAFFGCTSLNKVFFNGTMNDWNSANEDNEWEFVIECTDGDIRP